MLTLIKKWLSRRKEKAVTLPRVQLCVDEADMQLQTYKAMYPHQAAIGQGLLNSVAIPQSGGGGGGVAIRAIGESYTPVLPTQPSTSFDALYSVRRYREYASSYVNAYIEQRKNLSSNLLRKYNVFSDTIPRHAVAAARAEMEDFDRDLEQRFPKVHLIEQDVVDIGAELDILNMAQQPLDAVRVFFNERTLQIEVLSFDRPLVDLGLQEVYDSLADMPLWLTERLDVLHVMPAEPPTEEIAGIGRRIGARIFWVYVPSELTS